MINTKTILEEKIKNSKFICQFYDELEAYRKDIKDDNKFLKEVIKLLNQYKYEEGERIHIIRKYGNFCKEKKK